MEAVFSTSELVEHTFIKLTMRQLLRNQRVNTTWRAVILCSQSLRRGMWLAPIGIPLDPVVKDIKPWASEYVQRFRPNLYVKVDYSPRKRNCKHGHHGVYKACAMYKSASLSLKGRKFRLYGPFKPSYHDMFVTQPPVTTVDIFHESLQGATGSKRQIGTVRNGSGVKMGDVCAALDALRRSHMTATGHHILELSQTAMGFVWVDNWLPKSLLKPLKPGHRYGDCEVCAKAPKDNGAENASE